MATIYVGQDIRLTLTGDTDLGSGSAVIQYRPPNSNTVATLSTTVASTTSCVCYADIGSTVFSIPGKYRFWIRASFTSGKIGIGEPYELQLYSPGSGG